MRLSHLQLTTRQAAEILGISTNTLRTRTRAGVIAALPASTGTMRHHYVYDPKVIEEYRLGTNGHARTQMVAPAPAPAPASAPLQPASASGTTKGERGVIDRLAQGIAEQLSASITNRLTCIEQKLDALLRVWS